MAARVNRGKWTLRGNAVCALAYEFIVHSYSVPNPTNTIDPPSLGDWNKLSDPRSETARVPALNVYESRPSEPADKPFA